MFNQKGEKVDLKIKQSNQHIQNNGGLALVGKQLEQINIAKYINEHVSGSRLRKKRICNIISSWTGMLAQAHSHYEDITLFNDPFFMRCLNLQKLYSSSRFRQVTEELSNPEIMQIINDLNILSLQGKDFGTIICDEYGTEYIPCDIDVSPLDNSGSSKEGVSYTYKGHDGYAPIFAYIGTEGYMLSCQLRPGKQHCQKGTKEFILEVIASLKKLGILEKVLFRLDSGNDAAENIRALNNAGAKFIIKRNLRKESLEQWLARAKSMGEMEISREGKNVYTATISHIVPAGFTDKDLPVEIVLQATERSIDKHGSVLLINEIAVDTYWTNIGEQAKTVIDLYHNHGTSEQFHSELKSDMDIERLASGKFKSNALILTIGMLAFNFLRDIGMKTIEFKQVAPVQITVKRKRIKSVLRDMIHIACKMVKHAGTLILSFSKNCKWFNVFNKIYESYC